MSVEENKIEPQVNDPVVSASPAPAGETVAAPTAAPNTGPGPQPSAARRAPPRTGKVALDEIAASISAAGKSMSPKLRELLTGTVALRIVDRQRAFVFDPQAPGFTLTEFSGAEARSAKADCQIDLTESSLQRMWNGELNPQIAMLSDKITVSGKADLSVYFFNLVSAQ